MSNEEIIKVHPEMPAEDAVKDDPETSRQDGVHEAAALGPDKSDQTAKPIY